MQSHWLGSDIWCDYQLVSTFGGVTRWPLWLSGLGVWLSSQAGLPSGLLSGVKLQARPCGWVKTVGGTPPQFGKTARLGSVWVGTLAGARGHL